MSFSFSEQEPIFVSPERSSQDTMDLRSSRRRVRRDFLVNILQAGCNSQSQPIFFKFGAEAQYMARARNLSILVAIQFQLWPPGGQNQNNCTLSWQHSTGYSLPPIFFIFDMLLVYGNVTTPIDFGRHVVRNLATRGPILKKTRFM